MAIGVSVEISGSALSNAEITLVDSNGVKTAMLADENGSYNAEYVVKPSLQLGKHDFEITAEGNPNERSVRGSLPFSIEITSGDLNIAVLAPAQGIEVTNNTLRISLKATYEYGGAVEDANIHGSINGEPLLFSSAGNGSYIAAYDLSGKSAERLLLKVEAADAYGNSTSREFELNYAPAAAQGSALSGIFINIVIALIIVVTALAVAILSIGFFSHMQEGRLEALNERKRELEALKEYASIEFHDRKIDKAQYNELVKDYGKRLNDINAAIRFLASTKALDIGGTAHKAKKLFSKTSIAPAAYAIRKGSQAELEKEAELKAMMKILEQEFYKRRITEDEFRKMMFEARSKLHLLKLHKNQQGA